MPDNLQKKLRSAFTTPNAKGGLLIGPIGDFIDPGPSGGGASEPDDIQKTLRSARRKVMAELRQLFTPHI